MFGKIDFLSNIAEMYKETASKSQKKTNIF